MSSWILIFEPENKVISHMVTYTYQSDSPVENDKIQGSKPNDAENTPVPVEISIATREITLDGKVVYPNSQGADNFVVYPSQFILYPGDSKKIQVQWVGTSLPTKEVSFGFISTQIPLDVNPKDAPKTAMGKVSVASRYEGLIVVRPKGVKPIVWVDSAFPVTDSGVTSLAFLLNNKGTGMQTLKSMELTIAPVDKDGKIKFNDKIRVKDVKASFATNQSLFPGFRRKVVVPWPAGLPVGPVNVIPEFTNAKK